MNGKKKINILMVLGNTGRGGAQTFAMNVLRKIDLDRFHIDFAVNEIRDNGYTKEIYQLGSKIFEIPFFKGYNWASYVHAWDKILTENQYDIVHGNVSSSAAIYLKEARHHGCKTIAHSHSTRYRGNGFEKIIKRVFTLVVKGQADYWFACSRPAAERLFGVNYADYKHYYDIPNAIVAENYLFNVNSREKIRNELGITDIQKVYGHVGSFTAPKNHNFLLEVFAELVKRNKDAILILAGEGKKRAEIETQIEALGLNKSVKMVGNVGNVNEYMMAMDTMIFPSLFEGFPFAVLEAQATGLPIVLSDTITNEIFLTKCVLPVSLNLGIEQWADKCEQVGEVDRVSINQSIVDSKFNMQNCVQALMNIYLEMAGR